MSDVVAIKDQVEAAVQAALTQVLPAELAGTDPVVRRSDRADFQANGTLAVAKKAGRAPRDIGADVAGYLHGFEAEVSGPGFVNITVPDALTWSAVAARLDLSNTRTKDYVFDVDQMVATTGNTGVYLQYAHARVRSILRKAPAGPQEAAPGPDSARTILVDVTLPAHPAEKALALTLDAFGATLHDVAHTLEPHRLCGYLYDVATAFTRFYDACPVLKADDPAVRTNRLALCDLTGQTLATGLDLLGIRAPERM